MKVNLLLFAIGLLLGLYLSFMYCVATYATDRPPVPAVPVKGLQKEVASSESRFAGKLDSLQSENRKLVVSLDNTKAALQKAKAKTTGLEQKTKRLVQQNRDGQESPYAYSASCDSLIGTVEVLMQASVEKDSMYENVVSGLEARVQNRDSTIILGIAQYGSLKASFEKSLQSQSLLTKQNDWLNKTVKHQKVKSKVLTALILIGGGLATGYIIHH